MSFAVLTSGRAIFTTAPARAFKGAGYALASQPGLHNGVIGGLLGLAGSVWPTRPCWSDPLAALAR